MDSVKMKFALTLGVALGLIATVPVFAQSFSAASDISATVDGVRGRCGLGLLTRTTSSQTCQSFKDYGSRMQCVANDLSDELRPKDSPVLGEVARCYRALGDALVAGRGANLDQVNALEDVCRKLRHETLVPQSPLARDALLLASNALMPGFSRKNVTLPLVDPMMGIRLHDLPDCAVAFAVPSGPPSAAGTPGPNRVSRAGNGVSTSAIPPIRIVSLAPAPGMDLNPAAPPQGVPAGLADSQTTATDPLATASPSKPSIPTDQRIGAQSADKRGSAGADKGALALNASAPISESAVISALPVVAERPRKLKRRPNTGPEKNLAGYGEVASDARSRSKPLASSGSTPTLESNSGSRSSYQNSSNSGFSAANPPSLPLTGPPARPQTSGSVR